MANYFSVFPKILYSFDNFKSSEYVTNILSRFSFEETLKNNFSAYFLYTIRDGDTPEILAAKYYDSPNKHWLILMMNNIVDPQFDWPMDSTTLDSYIDVKYMERSESNTAGSGIYWARSNVYAYYITEKQTITDNIVTVNNYQVDANTYNDTPSLTETITLEDGNSITIETGKFNTSYYEYEVENNDSKREIKLLRREFLVPIETELKRVFS